MANILGWKDILRPIRDGYRHLFPSPDTGPTPEEREKQRQLHRLRGFTYFDTFAQLEAWTDTQSVPVQRANTPLFVRPVVSSPDNEPKANILLCHDHSGNYQDYEASTGTGVDCLQYHAKYLQYVESFIYFSHKLVCVPPPSWTNTLHRNGVKVFGTLLIEPQTKDADRLLYSKSKGIDGSANVEFPLAKILANIARHYGFDGWLINIEKPFSAQSWDPKLLDAFLRDLKEEMGDAGELIWYDALNIDNRVAYQNALTLKNLSFATTCGSILTNYCWRENDAVTSSNLAMKHGLPLQKIYFGIDVWAQNRTKLTQPRTTYPEKGGGGTNTGIAVNKLAGMGLSAGVFAPAWSFEHFSGNGVLNHSLEIDSAMWEGRGLLESLPDNSCSCGDASQRHPVNREYPIMRASTHFLAGTDRFFYTDFSMPFARHNDEESHGLYDGMDLHSQLGAQSILPHPSTATLRDENGGCEYSLGHSVRLSDNRSYLRITADTLDVVETFPPKNHQAYDGHLSLFKLNMPADGSLQLSISYFCGSHGNTDIYLRYTTGIKYLKLEKAESTDQPQTMKHNISASKELEKDVRLLELGICVRSGVIKQVPTDIAEIYDIRIAPQDHPDVSSHYSIENTVIERVVVENEKYWRLYWTFLDKRSDGCSSALALPKIPHSDITGPFSHFTIQIDGLNLGRSYALEHFLPRSFADGMVGKDVPVVLVGIGFDGREIARYEQQCVRIPL